MLIRCLTSIATMTRVYEKGDEVNWSDRADAQRMIRAGVAESLEPEPEPKAEKAAPAPRPLTEPRTIHPVSRPER